MRPWYNKWAMEHPIGFGWHSQHDGAPEHTPYCMFHTAKNKRLLSKRFFIKWCNISDRVHKQRHGNLPQRLYWRLHPDEI